MSAQSNRPEAIEFGRFKLHPQRRELLADGVPVELGGRAFEILLALVEADGAVLGKDELIARVWPGRVVEENNLLVQIGALRKALGPDRTLVRTVARYGYQLCGPLRVVSASTGVSAEPATRTNLPMRVTELIGREAELVAICALANTHRLLTLSGAGGIGKTSLSIECGRVLMPQFADGVWIAELGPLSDPQLVPVTVGGAVGLTLGGEMPSAERVAAALGSRQVLLILDNCEHLIEATARMAEAVLRVNPNAHLMATSREPLRVRGEQMYVVPVLTVPDETTEDHEELMSSGALRLLLARALAADPRLSLDGRAMVAAAGICRCLDGIPLAIELAAARLPALGVDGLAARLNDRFKLLAGGHRTALARHQTLRATLDWSYELLPPIERTVLRRLGVFAGAFTLDSAGAVVCDADISVSEVVGCLANLVAKSLVTVDLSRTVPSYRLLETTRAYALEKLPVEAELDAVSRRHAEYYRGLIEAAAAQWDSHPRAAWLAAHAGYLDNVRAALDWAFSPRGDTGIGVALTVASVPLWMHLSLMEECHVRAQRALASVNDAPGSDPRHEMQLYSALGGSLNYARKSVEESDAAWNRALELAERLDDVEYQLRALWALWTFRVLRGECRATLALARRFSMVAMRSADAGDAVVGDRMLGTSLYFLGEPAQARTHIDRALANYAAQAHRSHVIRFQLDLQTSGRRVLAQILWVQGFPDQAMRTAAENAEYAHSIGHVVSLLNALEAACLVALYFVRDLTEAQRYLDMLCAQSERHAVTRWDGRSRYYRAVLLVKRGDLEAGLPALRAALEELREARFMIRYAPFLGDIAQGLASAGDAVRGLELIDEALANVERTDERWCIAELLRIKGELLLQARPAARAEAIAQFEASLDWSRRQGALSWELRCATSLARVQHGQGGASRARTLLSGVYGRFTEGFGTADLQAAKELLEAWSRRAPRNHTRRPE
jgi:predicted ATPase/DNA-binding winged helix-turn-helix (wHTH) protein